MDRNLWSGDSVLPSDDSLNSLSELVTPPDPWSRLWTAWGISWMPVSELLLGIDRWPPWLVGLIPASETLLGRGIAALPRRSSISALWPASRVSSCAWPEPCFEALGPASCVCPEAVFEALAEGLTPWGLVSVELELGSVPRRRSLPLWLGGAVNAARAFAQGLEPLGLVSLGLLSVERWCSLPLRLGGLSSLVSCEAARGSRPATPCVEPRKTPEGICCTSGGPKSADPLSPADSDSQLVDAASLGSFDCDLEVDRDATPLSAAIPLTFSAKSSPVFLPPVISSGRCCTVGLPRCGLRELRWEAAGLGCCSAAGGSEPSGTQTQRPACPGGELAGGPNGGAL
mmetsp:Transcript_47826/g.138278  ORF Transcript_47826/g.138278 Transcript_47826/m.138278 type:complete len:343 (-) Transcript_47826:571-1599(-)